VEEQPRTTDDAALVRRARDGDHEAYAVLVRRHQALAVHVATLGCGRAEAEDAAQEGFVKAYRALGRFDPARPFRPWLLAIVANEARSRARSGRRAAALLERAASMAPAPSAGDAAEAALARIGAGRLTAAIATLSEADQEVLVLRFALDLGEAETATVLGCRRGTVKSRTSRALDRLRLTLGEEAAP
jgi:RNA polymerase sigma factor (sigma-70 family)